MKIKRFYESGDNIDISPDRIGEIIDDLKETASLLENKNKSFEGYLNELDGFKNNGSVKGNDQIDDSVFALQVIKKDITDSIDKIDTIINNLIDYNENGRKHLYTENK